MRLLLGFLFFVYGSNVVFGYEILLKTSPEVVTNGDQVTLICKINSSIEMPSVTWSRNATDIFEISHRPMNIIAKNYLQFKPIAGRFFTTMHGLYEHHIILSTNQTLDHGLAWQCGNTRYRSNVLVMAVASRTSPTTYCYDSVGCMLGTCTGVVVAVLLILYLIALFRGQVTCFQNDARPSEPKQQKKMPRETNAYVNIAALENKDVSGSVSYKM